jgi:hypothetical protein
MTEYMNLSGSWEGGYRSIAAYIRSSERQKFIGGTLRCTLTRNLMMGIPLGYAAIFVILLYFYFSWLSHALLAWLLFPRVGICACSQLHPRHYLKSGEGANAAKGWWHS